MLTLYYSKASSAVAAHILLEESGLDYEATEISVAEGAHLSKDYLAINAKGRVPALKTPDGVLTENPAILEHIAASHPQNTLRPRSDFEQARARSVAAYLCATVHVNFAHHKRGMRWARSQSALDDMKQLVPENLRACAAFLEQDLTFGPWALGDRYSFLDPYVFMLDGWMAAVGENLEGFPRLAAHQQAMRARPATRKILALHGLASG